ncbi:MAG: 8-oxoguanine deaminase [Pseudomonadota bacterium]|nr:8-oxoguanine deaminase [Pseudomonadota bacterium]
MPTLLLQHAERVVTMDATRREIADGAVLLDGRRIVAVGTTSELGGVADEVLDVSGCVVMPGLVNTHHHMYQSLTRTLPAAQDAELFDWLQALYPLWARMTPPMLRVATRVAMAELLLSGCTTSSDHLYLYPNGCRLDDSIEVAQEMGLRFTATRGAMSLGRSQGGLPPDSLVEDEAAILRDMQRTVERWHDPGHGSMVQVALAPCSPFSVSRELMRETARLARSLGVRMHTHLAESATDVAYSRERWNMSPAEYAESLEWLGPDVWHAHCVQLDAAGIARFGASGTGVAHCPCSNMRLASGIAPVPAMLARGVPVALGVDGSASNDGADLLAEARQALLLARVGAGPAALSARAALELATLGGATVLGRSDIGVLAPGMAADVAAFPVDGLAAAGHHDPVAALVLCAPPAARHVVVQGRLRVRDGVLLDVDTIALAREQRQCAAQLRLSA